MMPHRAPPCVCLSLWQVPLVSTRAALLDAVRDDLSLPTRLSAWHGDCRHPSQLGHTYLAQLVVERIMQAASSVAARPAPSATERAAAERAAAEGAAAAPLPPPVHGNVGLPSRASVCVHGDRLTPHVLGAHGFGLTDEGRGKPGYVATTPGATIRLVLLHNASASVSLGDAVPAHTSRGRLRPAPPCRSCPCIDEEERLPPSIRAAGESASREGAPGPGGGGGSHQTGRKGEARGRITRHKVNKATCAERKRKGHCLHPEVHEACPRSCGLCTPWTTKRHRGSGPPPTAVPLVAWLGVLCSYAHMGRAAVSCQGACVCAALEVDAHLDASQQRVSVLHLERVPLELEPRSTGPCILSVRVLPGTSSGEHKFKVLSLMMQGVTRGAADAGFWSPAGTWLEAGSVVDAMTEVGRNSTTVWGEA